MVQRIT